MHQHSNYRDPRRRRGKKKVYEKIFEEIMVENFPNMEKEIVNEVQEAQRVPYRINPRRNMPRHILIKLTKTKHKERILNIKSSKGKATSNIQGKPYPTILSSAVHFSPCPTSFPSIKVFSNGLALCIR